MTATGSVRVRVTAVAVVVTAAALALGGWLLLWSIERTQLAQIADDVEDQVDGIVTQLASGVPAEDVVLRLPEPGLGVVQVIDDTGDVVVAAPPLGAASEPIVFVSDVLPADVPSDRTIIARSVEGGGRVEEPLPGTFESAIPLQVRYERIATDSGTLTVAAASPLTEVTRSIDAVRRSLWFALPAVVALVGGIAWFVTGRALRPVEAIRAEVDEITHSTLHRRVPVPASGDEVGRLASTMNEMLDRLESAAERQRHFVADASHELRSPVATLRTELEVALASGGDDPSALRGAIEGALLSEARVEDLLADLLVLASIDERTPAPSDLVDLRAVADEEASADRPVTVTVEGTGVVRGAPTHLRRVIANLLDNASRHARSTVTVTVDGGRLVVDDDGPGIPPGDRERVFERFTRLDEARTRDDGGAGLGLSLVRAVVRAHEGRVWIEASPAGGTRVIVELPAGTEEDGPTT